MRQPKSAIHQHQRTFHRQPMADATSRIAKQAHASRLKVGATKEPGRVKRINNAPQRIKIILAANTSYSSIAIAASSAALRAPYGTTGRRCSSFLPQCPAVLGVDSSLTTSPLARSGLLKSQDRRQGASRQTCRGTPAAWTASSRFTRAGFVYLR